MSEKKKCCILDGHTTNPGDLSWEGLEDLTDLKVYPRTAGEQTAERAADFELLITNKVVLSAGVISELPTLEGVCLMSTGTNAVDLVACRERGIPVCNIPAYSTASVAEQTFSLLLAWARGVETHSRSVHAGGWAQSEDFCFVNTPQRELSGRTLGLYGFGDIGQAVARIAVAMGMRVLAITRQTNGKPDLGQQFVDEDTLLAESDVISLHCPLVPETDKMVNAGFLARMKAGAVLLNTGRGGLLDEVAVATALRDGRLGALLVDVLTSEPPPLDHPLLGAPNCMITPHVAWATGAARGRLIKTLTENIRGLLTGNPQNVVNGV